MTDRNVTPDDRRRYRAVALAVVAALAVVLVAAAVAPVFSEDRGGDRPPQIDQSGASEPAGQPGGSDFPFRAVLLAVVALCVLVIAVQFVTDPWRSLKVALGGAVFLGIGYLILRRFAVRDPVPLGRNESIAEPRVRATPTPNGSTGFDGGASTSFSWPVETIAAVVVAAGVIAVVVLFASQSDAVRSILAAGTADRGGESSVDVDAVGHVAGEAADRVESASTPQSADNAIYRAWSEMVALLGAPGPQSGTPRQFEAAAVESGMNPDDVHLLTQTFEEVRYGGAPLSEDRRERAIAALRRIEERHGGEVETTVERSDTASVEPRPRHDDRVDDDTSEGVE